MDNKKFEVKFKESKLELSLDTNQDGQKLVYIKVNMNEALQETMNRGDKIEGAKLVSFEFGLKGLKLKLDTDQDGEELLEMNIDFMEAIDEAELAKKING
jgi:translation elongation factor EF-1beta